MTPLLIYLRLLVMMVMVVMRSIIPEGWMKRGRSLQDNARCKNVKRGAESLSLLDGEYPLPNHLFLIAINRNQTTLDDLYSYAC